MSKDSHAACDLHSDVLRIPYIPCQDIDYVLGNQHLGYELVCTCLVSSVWYNGRL